MLEGIGCLKKRERSAVVMGGRRESPAFGCYGSGQSERNEKNGKGVECGD